MCTAPKMPSINTSVAAPPPSPEESAANAQGAPELGGSSSYSSRRGSDNVRNRLRIDLKNRGNAM